MKNIYIWGTCEPNGESYVWGHKPLKNNNLIFGWYAAKGEGGGRHLPTSDLFPKDKPQKFKLVPVDDDE